MGGSARSLWSYWFFLLVVVGRIFLSQPPDTCIDPGQLRLPVRRSLMCKGKSPIAADRPPGSVKSSFSSRQAVDRFARIRVAAAHSIRGRRLAAEAGFAADRIKALLGPWRTRQACASRSSVVSTSRSRDARSR